MMGREVDGPAEARKAAREQLKAGARHIKVTGNQIGDDLQLTIQDDGVGIPEQVAEGNGLRNMRDRASLLHGRLMVERIEKGTKVTLNVPCKVE